MDAEHAHPAESRPPTVADLVTVCRSLNECGTKYLVVGGFAVNQNGLIRAPMDIDVLVDDSLENQAKAVRPAPIVRAPGKSRRLTRVAFSGPSTDRWLSGRGRVETASAGRPRGRDSNVV